MNKYMQGYTDQRQLHQVDTLHAWLHGEPFPPVMVEIGPTNRCNQKCRFCYNQSKVEKRVELPDLISLVDQLADFGVKSILWQGSGEPLFHKGLPEAMAHCRISQTLTTNGVLFTPEVQQQVMPNLFYMRFSVIDSDPKRYSFLHGCTERQWQMLDENMRHAVRMREREGLTTAFTATIYLEEVNFAHAYDIVKYYKELGLDYAVIQEAVYGDYSPAGYRHYPSDSYTEEQLAEMRARVTSLCDDNFAVKVRFPINGGDFLSGSLPDTYVPHTCEGPKMNTVITAEGDVIPCWRGWGNSLLSFGNVNKQSFADIWNGSQRQIVMNYINTTPPEDTECAVCNQWKTNTTLARLKNKTEWSNFFI